MDHSAAGFQKLLFLYLCWRTFEIDCLPCQQDGTSDFIIGEVSLPSFVFTKDLLEQLASTFFSLGATICKISDLEQHASSVKLQHDEGQGESVSMYWCGAISSIYQSCSRVENKFTLSSLLLPPLPLASLFLRFYSTSPFTRLKPVRTLPRFVRKFLGLPKFLVFFSEQRERQRQETCF